MPYMRFDHPWIDESMAPLYIMRTPARMEDAELEGLLKSQIQPIIRTDHPYAFVLIAENLLFFPAKQRAMWAEAEATLSPFEKKWNAGQAFVVQSAFQRGGLKAVQWLSPPVYPYLVTASVDEAIAWGKEKLANRGIVF